MHGETAGLASGTGRTRGLACRANRQRGEVEGIFDGERKILCLTLGGLAELETALGSESLAALASRLSAGRLKAADLAAILGAGLRGGGNLLSDEDVAEMAIENGLEGAIRLAGDLLAAGFGPAVGARGGAAERAGRGAVTARVDAASEAGMRATREAEGSADDDGPAGGSEPMERGEGNHPFG